MAHLKRICITMLQHFVPLESRHGRLNSSSGTSACRTSLEKAVEEWRNTKCRRRGRPSGRLQAVVSQFPVVCLQRMGVCGSVGESGSVEGSWESWWWRRMEGGDEQSWAVTPNLAVATVASADGRCQAARALHCADADGKWLSARPALRCVRLAQCGRQRVPVGRARPDTAVQAYCARP